MPHQPRRVLIASRIYAPEPAAAGMRQAVLAGLLAARGAVVEVLTGRTADRQVSDPVPGVRVRRWPVARDSEGAVRGYIPYLSFDIPLALRLLVAKRPDVIVVEPPPTTGAVVRVLARLRRVPYVYYAADLVSAAVASTDRAGVAVRFSRWLEGFAMRGAGRVMAVSDELAEKIAGFGVERNRIVMIGNGVDTDIFRFRECEPSSTFVYAGTMGEVHGAGIFVRAFAQVVPDYPQARLVFLGQGPQAPAIRAEAEQLLPPGTWHMGPPVPPQEISRLLGSACAGLSCTMPGSGYEMTLITKAIATAATGTPVIFTGNGPTIDFVREGQLGWTPDFTADAVAAAMRAALEAPWDNAERQRRAAWVDAHNSLRAAGSRAADVVLHGRIQ